ncbi:hypothetical protein [Bauldia litoralis]|uniref:Uncharacterized protein n=1 Tax=Bauldia litoralis TaxID=665467 RepID=A0A1G6EMC0_9HYPH|nr:hypothetical protein [Bauldia litoralis]SDB58446.1 hypothetical protein SAMN02982931_04682 [Bauldia litoralis]
MRLSVKIGNAFAMCLAALATSSLSPTPVNAQQDTAPATNCPETVTHFRATHLYPMGCGSRTPPARSQLPPPLNNFEGVWLVEISGDERRSGSWYAALRQGHEGVDYRDPDGPWILTGEFRTYNASPSEVSAARIRTVFFDGESGGPMVVHPAGQEGVLIGRWSRDDKHADVAWRKIAPSRIESLTFNSNWERPDGSPVSDHIDYGQRAGRFEFGGPMGCGGGMRGNCHRVFLTIFGKNLAGPHSIWLDPESHLELIESHFVGVSGSSVPTVGYMKSVMRDQSETAAINLVFAVWDGIRPGSHVIWLDDIPIVFEINFPPSEAEVQPPPVSPARIRYVRPVQDGYAGIEGPLSVDGGPYAVEVRYDGEPPGQRTVAVTVQWPTRDGTGDKELVAEQSPDNPLLYYSEHFTVMSLKGSDR